MSDMGDELWPEKHHIHEPLGASPLCTPRRRKATSQLSRFFKRESEDLSSSCLNFPSTKAECFGLIQERFAHNAFQLLVAITFLHQTKGSAAVPILLDLLEVFPTPTDLGQTDPRNIEPFIRSLGLQNKRADRIVQFAKAWLENPPSKEQRYRHLNYPERGGGYDIDLNEQPLGEDDCRQAWEIAHLPGIGPYALDSWRIFCRDTLRGIKHGSSLTPATTEEDISIELNQEWTRVLPADKELKGYLRWRWARLGCLWNPETGAKMKVSMNVLQSLQNGQHKSYYGFSNPWLISMGRSPTEEQTLGGYHLR